ncbi:MAG: hypothetical protein IPL20_03195 [Saprospiraceae bacterium]|nr:hypothetical protein [Saprospiraceae bacterium]
MKKFLLFAILLIFVFSSCKDSKKKNNDNTLLKASLIQEWFPYSGYAGEVMAVFETSKENGIDLTLNKDQTI